MVVQKIKPKELTIFSLAVAGMLMVSGAISQDDKLQTNNKKVQKCLEEAKHYETMKTTSEEQYWKNLQKAQDFYLCAEREGYAPAGYHAASLSEAGVAKTLEPKEVIRLYTNAANAGHHLAAFEMYQEACGKKPNSCENPEEAEKWMIMAAKSEDPILLGTLGEFYEHHSRKTNRISRAISCYMLAAEKGDAVSVKRLKELSYFQEKSKNAKCF